MQEINYGEFHSDEKINSNFNELKSSLDGIHQTTNTYDQLVTLVTNKKLVPGAQYILSDYTTKYIQPDTNILKEMAVERLVLTATDVDKFNIICSSLDYPQDVIYYNFNLNKCEDDVTPRKGFILRRRDESPGVNIDAPLDWRTMVWARWKVNPTQYLVGTTLTDYAVWTTGAANIDLIYIVGTSIYMVFNNNIPTSNTDSSVFQKIWDLADVVKDDTPIGKKSDGTTLKLAKASSPINTLTFGSGCKSITIAESNYSNNTVSSLPNNVFGNDCSRITFDSNCYNNTFGINCYNNTFGSGCNNNTFGSNCNSNTFGSNCGGNVFAYACIRHAFGSSCNYNIFAYGCGNNTFGSGCSSNTFGINCYNNTFGSNCGGNVFAYGCNANTFGSGCGNNTFGSGCGNNTFGSGCSSNTFGINCYNNTFGSTCYSNTFGNYKQNLVVKYLRSKNLTAVTALESKDYTNTIEKRSDATTVYWSLNASNAVTAVVIA